MRHFLESRLLSISFLVDINLCFYFQTCAITLTSHEAPCMTKPQLKGPIKILKNIISFIGTVIGIDMVPPAFKSIKERTHPLTDKKPRYEILVSEPTRSDQYH